MESIETNPAVLTADLRTGLICRDKHDYDDARTTRCSVVVGAGSSARALIMCPRQPLAWGVSFSPGPPTSPTPHNTLTRQLKKKAGMEGHLTHILGLRTLSVRPGLLEVLRRREIA